MMTVIATGEHPGLEELAEALDVVGLRVRSVPSGDGVHGWDAVMTTPRGLELPVKVKRAALPNIEALRRSWGPAGEGPHDTERLPIVVADRIPGPAREWMREAGIGWLDLRGHLRIVGHGLFIDAQVPAQRERHARTNPLTGVAGLDVACWLLMWPNERVGVRRIAKEVGRSPSTVSEILKGLRELGLLDGQALTAPQDLFAEVATRWHPVWIGVVAGPDLDDAALTRALRVNTSPTTNGEGWALTDTMAAAAYGAPVGMRADHAPDFYLPDQATARRAAQLLGVAPTMSMAGAAIAAAPVRAVCRVRTDPLMLAGGSGALPLAHPLFVALDLARDPGRGREILDSWQPPKPWARVW